MLPFLFGLFCGALLVVIIGALFSVARWDEGRCHGVRWGHRCELQQDHDGPHRTTVLTGAFAEHAWWS